MCGILCFSFYYNNMLSHDLRKNLFPTIHLVHFEKKNCFDPKKELKFRHSPSTSLVRNSWGHLKLNMALIVMTGSN